VHQEPDRADYLHDLGASCDRMGNLLGARGQGDTARHFYQKALGIAQRLVKQEPERADYLRDLSVSFKHMGDLLRNLGREEQAQKFFQDAIEIEKRLADKQGTETRGN
jgi:tetratricopeptide (TPR) repeat protein